MLNSKITGINKPFAEVAKNNMLNSKITEINKPFAEVAKNNMMNNKIPSRVSNMLNKLQKNITDDSKP